MIILFRALLESWDRMWGGGGGGRIEGKEGEKGKEERVERYE